MEISQELYMFVFLLTVLVVYQIVPQKKRWIVLLLASYSFFACGKKIWVVFYMIGTTLFTYLITMKIKKIQAECKDKTKTCERKEAKVIKNEYKNKTKKVLIIGIVGLVATLFYTHYLHFFVFNIDRVIKLFGIKFKLGNYLVQPKNKLLLPIGISFYTLEAIGYMVDVYWDKIKIEKHPMKLALFLSFFPQLVEGPIASYSQTAEKLWEGKSLSVKNLKKGYLRIFWGLFKLYLISTRLQPLVEQLFKCHYKYSGATIIFAAVAYTTMLYMDFSGSIDVLIGSATLFGIELPENFRQPFASKSASEFWQRWHISLGVWFKTYIFYPASVSKLVKKWNKFSKKKVSKHFTKVGVSAICLFPVWLCNGIWHGDGWTFIFYGMYYFVILLLEVALEPVRNKILELTHLKEDGFVWKSLLSLKTLTIIFVGELFFRAKSVGIGLKMFASIFRNFELYKLFNVKHMTQLETGTVLADKGDYISIIVGVIVVAIFGAIRERNLIDFERFDKKPTLFKWAVYYALIISVYFFGAYGPGYDAIAVLYANF